MLVVFAAGFDLFREDTKFLDEKYFTTGFLQRLMLIIYLIRKMGTTRLLTQAEAHNFRVNIILHLNKTSEAQTSNPFTAGICLVLHTPEGYQYNIDNAAVASEFLEEIATAVCVK